jgi:hypothetical protein
MTPRLLAFHKKLAELIPCEPESVRADLHRMSTPELLVRYLNWADRYVAQRPRRVIAWEGFVRHGSAQLHREAVYGLAEKIKAGDDVTPFLSERISRFGYVSPEDNKRKPRGVEWRDKDYALNAFDVHHLHLKPAGTRALLYVCFSRNDAFFVMVGDHKSFDDGTLAQAIAECRVGAGLEFKGALAQELPRNMREQNRIERYGFSTYSQVGSHTVMGAMLSSAGTTVLHTMHANSISRAIKKIEPQLDDPNFCQKLFGESGTGPETPAFEWVMRHCDLCLAEATSGANFVVTQWRR